MNDLLREIRGPLPGMSIATLVFGFFFTVVALTRVVEFSGIGLSDFRRKVLVVAHVVGCLIFGAAFVVLALDVNNHHKELLGRLLFASLTIFFPVHIYIGLKRRIIIRDQMEKS
jgi:hypothetical protein